MASPTKVYERWSEKLAGPVCALEALGAVTAMNFAFSPMWIGSPSCRPHSSGPAFCSMRGRSDETAAEVNAEVLHEKDEERGGEGCAARGVDLGQLLREGVDFIVVLEKSPVVRSLTRRVTPAIEDGPCRPGFGLRVTASGREVGLVTQLSKWIYDRGRSITGLKRRGNQTRRHRGDHDLRGRGETPPRRLEDASDERRLHGRDACYI